MIEFAEGAEEELFATAAWYEERQDGLGARFLAEAERASGVIEDRPQIGARWTYSEVPSGVRRFPLRTFPYHLVYVEDPRLTIVAVAHMSRRPGYWRYRLRQL